MSELKYSGLTVAIGLGFITSVLCENLYPIFIAIVIGILYEIIKKPDC